MILMFGAMIGWIWAVKFYDVPGLWGTRNNLTHVAREAVVACNNNQSVGVDAIVSADGHYSGPEITDLSDCPKAPVTAHKKTP